MKLSNRRSIKGERQRNRVLTRKAKSRKIRVALAAKLERKRRGLQ